MHQLDPGGTARACRPQPDVAADGGAVERAAVDLAERQRDAERCGATRQPHRGIGVRGRDRPAIGLRLGDPLAGQKRAFDLDPMDVAHIGNRGPLHRRADRLGHRHCLRRPADGLGRQRRGMRRADREGLAAGGGGGAAAGGEDQEMRRQPTLGAAGHDHRNPRGDGVGGDPETRRQHRRHGRQRITASEIVDAAIALGLAEDRNDLIGSQPSPIDQFADPRRVAGIAHGHAVDQAFHRRGSSASDKLWRAGDAFPAPPIALPSKTPAIGASLGIFEAARRSWSCRICLNPSHGTPIALHGFVFTARPRRIKRIIPIAMPQRRRQCPHR